MNNIRKYFKEDNMQLNKSNYDIIIIGGGAAGLMSAALASQYNKNIAILEKNNRVGKKLLITGNGRCCLLYTSRCV